MVIVLVWWKNKMVGNGNRPQVREKKHQAERTTRGTV